MVSELRRLLEAHVVNAGSLDEKILAGLFTFMALATARFSDIAYAEEVIFDSDADGEIQFVEMRTKNFKTAR
eukprot:400239-Amphidinium_carterae.1